MSAARSSAIDLHLEPLTLSAVTIDDTFWAPRRELIRTSTLPQQERQLRASGRQFDALKLQWRPGDDNEPHIFWESDVAKWIEAASYVLATHPDPELEASVDEAIALLAGAQQDDGYLNTYFTVVAPGERFTDLRDAHELYCLGHLIEAAVAHYEATRKGTQLGIVRAYTDLVEREFGPGGRYEGGYDGHQEIELALVRLARTTGENRYLDLARRFINSRGTQPFYFDQEEQRRGTPGHFDHLWADRHEQVQRFREYNQSHLPVREQDEIVGHSVRAMYMLSAMADLARTDADETLLRACERLWQSMVRSKMYITGGIGTDHIIEGFGAPFDLPESSGYAETCAAIGVMMVAQRMGNLTRDGQYADVMERALYNGVLSGASSDGLCYFYGNPLASDGSVHRHEWFGVACCPPNLARLLSSLERYAYAEDRDELAVHLYIAGSVVSQVGGRTRVRVETSYPADGTVTFRVDPDIEGAEWTLSLRIPSWSETTELTINGERIDLDDVTHLGYARLRRTWRQGETVQLTLDVHPARVWADTRVRAAADKVALRSGPVIYCFEGIDNDAPADALVLPRAAALLTEPEPISGLVAIITDGKSTTGDDTIDPLYRSTPPALVDRRLRALPYFAWNNRGASTMTVWIREA